METVTMMQANALLAHYGIDPKEFYAQRMIEWTTVLPATAFADEVRWRMTGADRNEPAAAIRFGGGSRLSDKRCFYISGNAARKGVDAVYLTFGTRLENGPSQAFVAMEVNGKRFSATCDLWQPERGPLQLVSRCRRRLHIAIGANGLTLVGSCSPELYNAGRKRAKAMLRDLAVSRPGRLRDQHFFEDCSIFAPFRVELSPEMVSAMDAAASEPRPSLGY
jgi:hypothetical protein